jgi:hypothetical protein
MAATQTVRKGPGAARSGWPRNWARWAGYAAAAWAAGFGILALTWALGNEIGSPPGSGEAARAGAAAIALTFLIAAPAALETVRPSGPRVPRSVPSAVCWCACGLAGAGTFGFVMNFLQLIFDGRVDDWASFAVQLLCAAGAVLFAGTALAYRRRSAGACARCGRVHAPGESATTYPPPSVPSRAVRWTAYAGAVAFVPYATMKTIWASGGTFAGVSGEEMLQSFKENGASGLTLWLEEHGLDFTTLSAAAGVFLLLGLVRPWGQIFPRWAPFLTGRRVPRWLPLTPAWLGAATLGPYGVFGLCYLALAALGVMDVPEAPEGNLTGTGLWLVTWIGLGAFGPFGVALGVAALSYQRRTRPRCAPAEAG